MSWHIEGEFFRVVGIVLAPNKINVRLSRDSAISLFQRYQSNQSIDNYRGWVKDKLKSIKHDNRCLAGGWIGEEDFDQAVAMFVAGHTEFFHNVDKLVNSPKVPYIYMNTERGAAYPPRGTIFYIGE